MANTKAGLLSAPVPFNIDETIANMLGGIKDVVTKNWDLVKTSASAFMDRRKDRLELLASLRICGDITSDQFDSRISDEKDVLEAEMHAIAVITLAIAQQAANAAINILQKAVNAALPF